MNPFEAFDLDPSLGLSEITERLRERMDDAQTDDERDQLRQGWETLTRNPLARFRFALSTPPSCGETLTPPVLEPPKDTFGVDVLNPIDFLNLANE